MPLIATVLDKNIPLEAAAAGRQAVCAKVLRWIAGFVSFGLIGHAIVLLWAQHEFTSVESLVALHANMLVEKQGIYFDLNHYPFTVTAYGPIFYSAAGFLHKLGVPSYQSGRALSFSALLVTIWLCWQALGLVTSNRYARATGVILAASTANLLFWGTVGQVDMLAVCFSLAAFTFFLHYRRERKARLLIYAGLAAVLAMFTKQTALAACAAITVTLAADGFSGAPGHLKRLRPVCAWIAGVGLAAIAIVAALNAVTHGGYFKSAIVGNIVPFAWVKLQQHAQYLLLTGGGVILTAVAGVRKCTRTTFPLYVYCSLSLLVWLLTAPKIGSDLNYQIESMFVLSICAASALDQLDFFPGIFESRKTWVTLLQMPLLLHVALNLVVTGRIIAERALIEPLRRNETLALKSLVTRPGRIISVDYDSLVHYRGSMEVEPLIYTLLARRGLIDPQPLTNDLIARRFETIILHEDVFQNGRNAQDPDGEQDAELPQFPASQLNAIRQHYKLTQKIDGVYSLYVYNPRQD